MEDIEYKKVNVEYLKEAIKTKYTICNIERKGGVVAKAILADSYVFVTDYDEKISPHVKELFINNNAFVHIIREVNSRVYSSIMESIRFVKTYYKNESDNLYYPVRDPLIAYRVNENIEFLNPKEKLVKLSVGDYVISFDASNKNFYGIYDYYFKDFYNLI